MTVQDLINELEKLKPDVEVQVAGKPSYISYSNIEIETVCFDEDEEDNKRIEAYVLKPKE